MNTTRASMAFLLVCLLTLNGFGQSSDLTPLFQEEKPLTIRFKVSLKAIKKQTVETIYLPSTLYYKN